MENIELKVGDVIYKRHYQNLTRMEIDKVTPKQAAAGHVKFKKEYTPGNSLSEIGKDTWGACYYYVETEELKSKFQIQQLVARLSKVRWEQIPVEKLEKVNEVLSQQ